MASSEDRKVVGFGSRIRNYFSEVFVEMKKVSWPTNEELRESTVVVLTVTGILAAFTFAIDFLIGEVIKELFK